MTVYPTSYRQLLLINVTPRHPIATIHSDPLVRFKVALLHRTAR